MSEEIVTDYMIRIQELKQQLQLEKDNVAELNELLISYKEENEKLKQGVKVSMEWASDCCKVCTFKEENEELRKLKTIEGLTKGFELNRKLQQKLEKIEEVCCKCKNDTDMYVRMYGYNMYVSKIQEIIEE